MNQRDRIENQSLEAGGRGQQFERLPDVDERAVSGRLGPPEPGLREGDGEGMHGGEKVSKEML